MCVCMCVCVCVCVCVCSQASRSRATLSCDSSYYVHLFCLSNISCEGANKTRKKDNLRLLTVPGKQMK